jgi:hypothetical protein
MAVPFLRLGGRNPRCFWFNESWLANTLLRETVTVSEKIGIALSSKYETSCSSDRFLAGLPC